MCLRLVFRSVWVMYIYCTKCVVWASDRIHLGNYRMLSWRMWGFRSVCENSPHAKRQAAEEEEDQHQEVYSKPLLQRVVHI